MANGQFETADVLGDFNRGQQFKQQRALEPIKLDQAAQNLQFGRDRNEQSLRAGELGIQNTQGIIDQRNNDQKNQSLFNTALRVQSASDDQIIPILEENINRVTLLGGDPKESIAALNLAKSGDIKAVRSGADNLIKIGERQGDIKAPSTANRTLDIRQQEADLRKADLADKQLDRKIKIETNILKRNELTEELKNNKIKSAQTKRDIKFNAQSSVDAVSNSITTIDSMLQGSSLESAAGFQANFPTLAGTDASDFEAMLDTFQSQAFLSQVEKMKGLGALSENEGKKLGAAIGTLSIDQSDKALRTELGRIKGVLNEAKKRMQKKFGISTSKTGELNADEIAELQQLRSELGR